MAPFSCPKCGALVRADNFVPNVCPMCGSKRIEETTKAFTKYIAAVGNHDEKKRALDKLHISVLNFIDIRTN